MTYWHPLKVSGLGDQTKVQRRQEMVVGDSDPPQHRLLIVYPRNSHSTANRELVILEFRNNFLGS